MAYILEDRFTFKALYNGKVYHVKSFCDEFIKLYRELDLSEKDYYYSGERHLVRTEGDLKEMELIKTSLKDITKLLQCTSLKDKNGKLIYEDNLLKCNEGFIWKVNVKVNLQQAITYTEFECSKYHDSEHYVLDACEFTDEFGICQDLEIVGNVYENLELFK